MTDSIPRSYRSRDPLARGGTDPAPRRTVNDPLAELARLIGQSSPLEELSQNIRNIHAERFDEPLDPAPDWATDDDYADRHQADERYAPRRQPESYDSFESSPADLPGDYDDEPLPSDRHVGPTPTFDDAAEDLRDQGKTLDLRYRDTGEPPNSYEDIPAFLPESRDDRYEFSEPDDGDEYYSAEEDDDETPQRRKRSGSIVIIALLGLAVLGTAGAFAYRSMFGGSVLPSLPPIIKASDGPNKIVPKSNTSNNDASSRADATNTGSGEKLVSHDEQPVDVQELVKPAPRVVSTIPIFPDPNSAPIGPQSTGPESVASAAPMSGPQGAAPMQAPNTAPAAPSAATGEFTLPTPKKIHTVSIRPDQSGANVTTALPPPAPQAQSQQKTSTRAPAPKSSAPPAPRPSANAPLDINPARSDSVGAAPSRSRTTVARASTPESNTPAAAAPSANGAYAVQVTSQRSEAEAQAAFRSLQAKFPNQLGGHQPIIRRADLGAKGVYYRALVGPYASAEQAAGMCSNLKAAGGNCIVQRN